MFSQREAFPGLRMGEMQYKEWPQVVMEAETPSLQIQGQPSGVLRRSAQSSSLRHDKISVDVSCTSEWAACPMSYRSTQTRPQNYPPPLR